jgi:Protein of unknown function (DUF3570)
MKNNSNTLIALTAAAMLLPSLSKKADANTLDQKTTFDFKLSNYQEGDIAKSKLGGGSPDRYSIDVKQFKFKTPITSSTEVSISGVQESMSGASPWFVVADENGKLLQVMSGATIDEKRQELGADFRISSEFSDSSLSLGYSQENDYVSFSGGLSGSYRFNQNLTTIDYGANISQDYIDATDADIFTNRPTDETKTRYGMVLGFSQVLSKTTLLGVSASLAYLDGYLSDPYKLVIVAGSTTQDSRPSTNQQFSTTVMLREFFTAANAALHVDYRFYSNDWEVKSNTLEIGWHQNFGETWKLAPSFRLYQQSNAAFYQPVYNFERRDGYYSSDYRLSEFSATSMQIKLVKTFGVASFNASYEQYEADGDNPAMISYALLSLGVSIKF